MTQQQAVDVAYKTNDSIIFKMMAPMLMQSYRWITAAGSSSASSLKRKSINDIWDSSKSHPFSVRAKWIHALIRRLHLIVIGQESSLSFPSCHRHKELHYQAISVRPSGELAILDLNACGPSLFLPFVSREK